MYPAIAKAPLRFDPKPIAAEVARFGPSDWVRHFNRAIYDGDWSGIALRSLGGRTDNIYPDAAGTDEWRDTRHLASCPATAALLAQFRCPLRSVRFLRLGPGSSIAEHSDPDLDLDHGELRLHLPIVSNDGVRFWLDGDQVAMEPGECWYLDLDRLHAARNDGAAARIHLVIDCEADDWVTRLVADTDGPPRTMP